MKKIDLTDKRVLISRTDSIGDVMLTLPLCAWIKEQFPSATVLFLGKNYTTPVLNCFSAIDEVYDWHELSNVPSSEKIERFKSLKADCIIHVFPNKDVATIAKKAGVAIRVGTSHRSYHLLTCNYRLNFTRKRSELHESQLNFELLRPFGLTELPELIKLQGYTKLFHAPLVELPEQLEHTIQKHPSYYILHPKSQGSALEWPIEKYILLAEKLTMKGHLVLFTGTESEGSQFRKLLPKSDLIIDTTGTISLDQLIKLLSKARGIVACSTGPLHLGGFLGITSVGLFSSRKPIHPGRWRPLGPNSLALVADENCIKCQKKENCKCIETIEVEAVLSAVIE